ncbi:MAG: aminotransferase class IV [Bacteroidales bacterium]
MSDAIGNVLLFNGKSEPISRLDELNPKIETEKIIYEVIRVVDLVPLFINDYFERLSNSFGLLQKQLPFSKTEIIELVMQLFSLNKIQEGPVKLVFGVGESPFNLLYIMKAHVPDKGGYENGVKTILLFAERDNPNAKVWNAELRYSSINELEKTAAYEAILVNKDGYLTEGSRSNLFFVKDRKLYTCPDNFVLPGITRKKVLEIAGLAGIEVVFEPIHEREINRFDAAFLSGTSRKIVPVRQIGETTFSTQNEVLKILMDRFDLYVANYIAEIKKRVNYRS